ncbi:hypothetical protein CYMTET_8277 [Cymbomonas tetramitiformis]|uniref:Uncharacterized protein n=1 Tax=Cymbomonas tetramitiformis TaxID=36881 RepID=A0AAE0GTI3_9CHLO|nr:hypothetical protein CYMTET_8277 [Cymbomonas tetramitiformis]
MSDAQKVSKASGASLQVQKIGVPLQDFSDPGVQKDEDQDSLRPALSTSISSWSPVQVEKLEQWWQDVSRSANLQEDAPDDRAAFLPLVPNSLVQEVMDCPVSGIWRVAWRVQQWAFLKVVAQQPSITLEGTYFRRSADWSIGHWSVSR